MTSIIHTKLVNLGLQLYSAIERAEFYRPIGSRGLYDDFCSSSRIAERLNISAIAVNKILEDREMVTKEGKQFIPTKEFAHLAIVRVFNRKDSCIHWDKSILIRVPLPTWVLFNDPILEDLK